MAKKEACWGQTHLEVFLFAMRLAHGQSTGRTPQAKCQSKLYTALGTCISFYLTAYCSAASRCIYQHLCLNASCLGNPPTSNIRVPQASRKAILGSPQISTGPRTRAFALHPQPMVSPHRGTYLRILATANKPPLGDSHTPREREGGATSLVLPTPVRAGQLSMSLEGFHPADRTTLNITGTRKFTCAEVLPGRAFLRRLID